MPSYVPPKRATAYVFFVSLVSQANTKVMQSSATLAAGDVKVSKDGGALANLTTLPAVTPGSSKLIQVDLSAAEMTADNVTLIFSDAAGSEWCDLTVNIRTTAQQIDDLATQASVNTIDDFLDTEIAAIKAKTDSLPSDPADASDIAASFTTVNGKLDTIDDFLDTEVAAIKAKTDNLPSDPADASDITAAFSTVNSTLSTIGGYIDTEVAAVLAAVDTEVAAIKAKTDGLPSDPADASDIATSFATVNTKLDTIDDLLDTEIAALTTAVNDVPTNAELATALAAADDAVLAAIAGLTIPSVADILAGVVEGSITLKGALRLCLAVLAGKSSGGGTATVTFRDVADAKARVTATVTADGNRTAITRDITD